MNYDLNFLESKLGKFDREFTYPKISLIEGFLIYIEKDNKEDLKKEINNIKNEGVIFPAYIWGYVTENNSIYLSRSFGENKVFNFNPDWNKKTDFIKSKEKVLKNLDIETINDLFDQKSLFDSFYKKLWYIRIDLAKAIRY